MLSFGLFAFSLSVGHLFLLLESTMTLLIHLAIAIEAATAAVVRLVVHVSSKQLWSR
jgi:hypothetical protein